MKKILTILLLCIISIPVINASDIVVKRSAPKNSLGTVFEYNYKGNVLSYMISKNNTVAVYVKNKSLSREVEIPSSVTYEGMTYTVAWLDNDAFTGVRNVEKIVVPGTVRRVSMDSFVNCPDLREVWLGDGVGELSGHPFKNCPKVNAVYVPRACKITNEQRLHDANIKVARIYKVQN